MVRQDKRKEVKILVYEWRISGIYDVDAQVAGDELEWIYKKNGCLEPSAVVEESRPQGAPLHAAFEWDDAVAAEKYREMQAGDIIRAVVAVEPGKKEKSAVRAFVHVQETYRPMALVVQSRDMMQELQDSALRELQAFQRKYRELQRVGVFEPVFAAIGQAENLLEQA